jgi:anaerobic magnesium-protoporphyrin IX monomethyl ester cyclase
MYNLNKTPVISLISPPTRSNSRHVPIALICLAAWLDKEGIENTIIDIKIQRDPLVPMQKADVEQVSKEIIRQVRDTKPQFVGLPCYTSDYSTIISLSKRIKEQCDVKVIVGGLHASLKYEDFLFENSPIDFAVIGEGEITLSELIEASSKGLSLENINGIAFRKGGEIIKTRSRERIVDLSILPRPAYQKIDMDYYLKPNRYIVRLLLLSGLHLFTTRGCPNQCTFCANRMRMVTYRPLKDVVEEIKWLKENYSIDSFYIADDTFCLKKERVLEFISLMNKLPYKLIWAMETTVKSVDEEMIKELKKAGCIQIDFGVESGSQEALNRMKKGITIVQIENAFRLCRKYGLRTFPTLMFNTPDETEEDVKKTIGLMKRIKATNYGINLTVPYLGTEIYEKYVFPKLTKEEYHIYDDPDLYHTIPDKRFLLAKHNINLDKLYIEVLFRFTFLRKVFDMTLNSNYWLTLLKSKRKNDYVIYLFENFKRQVKVFGHYFLRFVSTYSRKGHCQV